MGHTGPARSGLQAFVLVRCQASASDGPKPSRCNLVSTYTPADSPGPTPESDPNGRLFLVRSDNIGVVETVQTNGRCRSMDVLHKGDLPPTCTHQDTDQNGAQSDAISRGDIPSFSESFPKASVKICICNWIRSIAPTAVRASPSDTGQPSRNFTSFATSPFQSRIASPIYSRSCTPSSHGRPWTSTTHPYPTLCWSLSQRLTAVIRLGEQLLSFHILPSGRSAQPNP